MQSYVNNGQKKLLKSIFHAQGLTYTHIHDYIRLYGDEEGKIERIIYGLERGGSKEIKEI